MSFSIPKGDSKASYVESKFTSIAERYDLFNDITTQGMHRYWKRYLVKKAGLKRGDCALDICCGTGDITQLLQKSVTDEGNVVGLDFSSGMLSVATSREKNKDGRFIQGDATVLPVSSSTQNAVTVGFGLRNLVDIPACLKEVFRVLKPGGRFVCLDMGKVKVPIVKDVFDFYFFKVVPRIGKLLYPGEDMFDYFPESTVEYPSQDRLAEMLASAGFRNVRYFNFYFGSTVIHCAEKH